MGFPSGEVVKNPPANTGDTRDAGLFPGSGRSPGGGSGNSLQYSCLEIFHGQSIMLGYSPWGRKESDMTERLSLAHYWYFPGGTSGKEPAYQ